MNHQELAVYSVALTHKGHCRAVNEDAVYDNIDSGIWAIADGMGGYAAGDVASKIVVNALHSNHHLCMNKSLSNTVAVLKQAILKANYKLLSELTLPEGCSQAGSTVVVLKYHLLENRCACLWVGDSRAYVFRNNQLFQMTKDHSLVQEMVDDGVLDPCVRDSHPKSNVITRAVGVCSELEVDVVTFSPQSGDLLLLCSDGLYNEVTAEQMLQCILASGVSQRGFEQAYCDSVAHSLMQKVLHTKARDNVSINVIVLA